MRKLDLIKTLTALSIIFCFNLVGYSLVFIEIPASNKELYIHFLGIVEGAFVGSLMGFYWTRSHKDDKAENV